MIVPCLTLCPLEMPGAKSAAWAQKKYVPFGVVVGGGGGVGGGVGAGGVGWVGGGVGTVAVGRGRVDGGLVGVGGDVGGGAVVVVGGGTIWARACQMAAAPKAMVTSTTI